MMLFMPTVRRQYARGTQKGCSNKTHWTRKLTMGLELLGHIELPEHVKSGGFAHAGMHSGSSRLYVANTANDALKVVDGFPDRDSHSVEMLPGVAGALVSDEQILVFA